MDCQDELARVTQSYQDISTKYEEQLSRNQRTEAALNREKDSFDSQIQVTHTQMHIL